MAALFTAKVCKRNTGHMWVLTKGGNELLNEKKKVIIQVKTSSLPESHGDKSHRD